MRPARWLLLVIGLALAGSLLLLADPGRVWVVARHASLSGLAWAFLLAVAVALFRGLRLRLVAGPALSTGQATGVICVSQLATSLLPWRLGELALVPLLHFSGVPGTVRGLSYLVVLRLLDLVALLALALAAAAATGAHVLGAVLALAGLCLTALTAWLVTGRGLRRIASAWRHRRPFRRTLLARLLEARRELRNASRSRVRLAGAVASALAIWAGVWAVTAQLLRAMNLEWAPATVLLGVIGATLGAALPINAVGNFGTLEGGWTVAAASTGMAAHDALVAGFAAHLWNLVFTVVLGAVAAAALALSHPGSRRSSARAARSQPSTTRHGP
jgi:hypothetical protein